MNSVKCVAQGKVRSLYASDNDPEVLLVVTSDKISAYDVVLNSKIPGKAAVLTALSKFWFEYLEEVGVLSPPNAKNHSLKHHLITTELSLMPQVFQKFVKENSVDQNALMLVKKLKVVPIEAIVRGYLAGSAYKDYSKGLTSLPMGLAENQKLPQPIFTPSTKAEYGQHDENISFDIMRQLLNDDNMCQKIRDSALMVYSKAAEYALSKGIIIADTKFEFGLDSQGQLYLIDEVLTPDSSRFWPSGQQQAGASLDKQFVRDYLTSIKFNKKTPIELPPDIIEITSQKYKQIYEVLSEKTLNQN